MTSKLRESLHVISNGCSLCSPVRLFPGCQSKKLPHTPANTLRDINQRGVCMCHCTLCRESETTVLQIHGNYMHSKQQQGRHKNVPCGVTTMRAQPDVKADYERTQQGCNGRVHGIDSQRAEGTGLVVFPRWEHRH